jgi:hypothetical protein
MDFCHNILCYIERMKRLTPRIIFAYTDTQLLEVYQGIFLTFVNPMQLINLKSSAGDCSELFLTMGIMSIFCGALYIFATLSDYLNIRVYASLFYWLICCCIMSLLYKCHALLSVEFIVSYTIQMVFAFYIHLRLSREYHRRKKNGTK